jgi:glutathione peroxidase
MGLYDIPVTTLDGEVITLERYRGRALLIVNVASHCGFTPQYRGLETLYRRYQDRLVVLGFPCNQFGRQEPGTEAEIRTFCADHYAVTFPMFAKVDVNGASAHPLFRQLKAARKGLLGRESIAWNFTKFLVGKDGDVLRRYAPRTTPDRISRDLATLI